MKVLILSLTLFRIISGPIIFVLTVLYGYYFFAVVLYLLAAVSDFLDGNLARSFNLESRFGEILDPVADKILVLFSLLSIIFITNNAAVTIVSGIILSREFWISGLRDYNARNNNSSSTSVTKLAKMKTGAQFISILFYFIGFGLNHALIIFVSHFLLLLSCILALKSGLDYTLKTFMVKIDE